MDAERGLPIESSLVQRLQAHLMCRGGAPDLQHALSAAIEMWLAEQSKLRIGSDPASVRGYQWKSVFLPEGTQLCTRSYGESQYARVQGEEIIFRGRTLSPNQFAHWAGRGTRNAWNDIYVRRPQDKFYIPASRLRAQVAQELACGTSTLPVPLAEATGSATIAAVTDTSAIPATMTAPATSATRAAPAAPATLPAQAACSAHAAHTAHTAHTVQASPTSPPTSGNLLAEVLNAVVTALQANEQTRMAWSALFPQPDTPAERDCSKGVGWNLPERRKYRFRIEDVAFS